MDPFKGTPNFRKLANRPKGDLSFEPKSLPNAALIIRLGFLLRAPCKGVYKGYSWGDYKGSMI